LLAKAGRGELALPLPAGLVRDPSGVVIQDPDQEVRSRIALVFTTFLRQRTAVQVARTFHACGLALPRRDIHGDIRWRRATIAAITTILHNPAYAGAFAYGRIRSGSAGTGGRRERQRSTTEWRIVVKDRYPAYIDWGTFEKIQAMLADNHADYRRVHGRGVPRDGAALLHGITWCGECGHKMVVSYKPRSRYVRNVLHRQQGAAHQACLSAAPIDDAVAMAFLEAVVPAELDALDQARKVQRDAEAGLRRAAAQQVERLRYQASLAERQFDRVDPDNRLVAAELERRWEAALVELRRAEEALARAHGEQAADADADRRRLLSEAAALGRRLPAIWADPATGRAQRKALLRCLIDKVVLRRAARDQAAVRIVWRAGATTELVLGMPVNALAALPRAAEFEARVLKLAKSGLHDEEIARELTAEGYRSACHATRIPPATIRRIRSRHGIKFVPRCTRWPQVPGWLTASDIAARLRLPEKWLREQLRAGVVKTRREPSGRYLLPDSPDTSVALERLRSGAVQQVHLAPSDLQQVGYQDG
jgi:recombinase